MKSSWVLICRLCDFFKESLGWGIVEIRIARTKVRFHSLILKEFTCAPMPKMYNPNLQWKYWLSFRKAHLFVIPREIVYSFLIFYFDEFWNGEYQRIYHNFGKRVCLTINFFLFKESLPQKLISFWILPFTLFQLLVSRLRLP